MSRWMIALLVGHLERAAQLLADRQHHRHRQGPARHDHVLQRLALDELHRDVVEPAHLAEVVGPHHVPVRDPPRQLDLLLEALERRGLGPYRVGEEGLDRDRLLQLAVPRPVDDAHPAHAQHPLDLVAPVEHLARLGRARHRLHRARQRGRGPPGTGGEKRLRRARRRCAQVLDQLPLGLEFLHHPLERARQLADLVAGAHLHRRGVVAVGDAAGQGHERPHRPPDLARHQPPPPPARAPSPTSIARTSSVRWSRRNAASSASCERSTR